MEVRLAGVNAESVTDGVGLRAVAYLQGCTHACPGCHNPASHSLTGGYLADTDDVLDTLLSNPLLSGLTISGGEPLLQAEATLALAAGAKARGYSVWLYTGYVLQELAAHPLSERILGVVDVLVDGPYLAEERDLALPYRGSRNQRLLRPADWSHLFSR
ncbi:MAG: 4Fe-4S single cluster domain-containing protein [Bacillota bacterium]